MMLAGLFHQGGVVGRNAGPARTVDASLFVTARRYDTGGIAGLTPDELPAILSRGDFHDHRDRRLAGLALAPARARRRRCDQGNRAGATAPLTRKPIIGRCCELSTA